MIGQQKKNPRKYPLKRVIVNLVLVVAMLCGLVAPMVPTAEAAGMDYYLKKAVEWGVMRGDINGNLNANRKITRAEFVTMVNRAYGYTQMGENPFKDVTSKHWFYEDVRIGHKIGYFKGVTPTTAAPYSSLTREQAAVIIGRNMMLEQGTGEALGFSDSRLFGDWSRHMIEAVAKEGIITGYSDGNFRPKQHVTRGQVAAMLVRAVGTPVQNSGVQSLGGVYGNLTITAPGVTLKDTTVYGNLYISGGVDLSNVVLENVKVTGRIIVAGTGESQKGEHSVILRNVTAKELVLDSISKQFVTLKAEGLTHIEKVNVRTGAYLEDVTDETRGLRNINLKGAKDTVFQLAGNIKDVVVLSPQAKVTLAQGAAKNITVDEKAAGSKLHISEKAVAKNVNLDAATEVTGTGSIAHANVNTAGSTSTILPDTITVRPGITAEIKGEVMDSAAAQESSEDPRLLSGYPDAKNIAPKTADLAFKTNKKGTIYWAVTALSDGTVEAEDLINPPAYSGKILHKGTVDAKTSNTEFMTKISGLTTDGSYYVSAILVDNRGMRSPVKIDAFTTPDDTVPDFASGYPYTLIADDEDQEQIIQAMAMPNKNCQMYYALLPKGSSAPKPADFKANAVTGNLGFGVVELQKNTPYLVAKVNTAHLQEETDYDLYLWLTDADGTKSSAVKRLTVRTLDRTPPKIQHLTLADVTTSSVSLKYALNEPGTLYWAVVKNGAKFYAPGITDPTSPEAMAQIESGINALVKGSSTASQGMTDVTFTISGLQPQTAYDVYYMAKDRAGNYCVYDMTTIKLPYTVYTLDNNAPTVKQEFTHDGSSSGDQAPTPYPDTSIRLVFSENIKGILDRDQDGEADNDVFLDLYHDLQAGKLSKDQWAEILRDYFKLYRKDEADPVKERNKNSENDRDWVIDYRNVKVEMDRSGTGEMIMTFPYKAVSPEDPTAAGSALNLSGGVTYQFRLEGLADTSTAENHMEGERGITKLPEFTTISAQIMLKKSTVSPKKNTLSFSAKPLSHLAMPESVLYDLVVWSEQTITFKLHKYNEETKQWEPVETPGGTNEGAIVTDKKWVGVSLRDAFYGGDYEALKSMKDAVYGLEITSINGDTNSKNWNRPVTLQVTAMSGGEGSMEDMGRLLKSSKSYEELMAALPEISDITTPLKFSMTYTFLDETAPSFNDGYPNFDPGDTQVKIRVSLDRPNSYFYYVVAPLGEISTILDPSGDALDDSNWANLPEDGSGALQLVSRPTSNEIMTFRGGERIKVGRGLYSGSVSTVMLMGLEPKSDYVAYFVLKGEAQSSASEKAYCFRFRTGDVATPIISLQDTSPRVGVKTSTDAKLDWILMANNRVNGNSTLKAPFFDQIGVDANDPVGTTKDMKQEDFKKNIGKYFPGKTEADVGSIRVIDALEASMGNNETESVFDYYAGMNVRDQVLTVIRESAGQDYVTDRGTINDMNAGQSQFATPQGMKPKTEYYFIAAARHPLGSNYGFKAVAHIHVVDADPIEVSMLNHAFTKIVDKDGKQVSLGETLEHPGAYKYDGRVMITFQKTPFWISDIGAEPEPLKGKNLKDLIMDPGAKITDASISGQTITITFKEAEADTNFALFQDGWLTDAYGNTQNKRLKVRLNAPFMNPSGKPAFFEYEWSEN